MVKKLKELGEFGLIDRIKSVIRIPEGMTGIGDDCAVIPQGNGVDLLVSTDMLVEGTHFIMDDIRPYRLGWKSAAVNLSDIAAMGGLPVATFLSFALPEGLDSGWTDEFFQGYNDISNRYHCVLLGGDTTASPDKVCVSVAILGRCMSGKAIMRSGARDGDKICVTGYLGDAGGGLKVILEGARRNSDAQALIAMHYQPIPRVEEGLKLAVTEGVHSMIDISDGIGSDLRHILTEFPVSGDDPAQRHLFRLLHHISVAPQETGPQTLFDLPEKRCHLFPEKRRCLSHSPHGVYLLSGR